MVHFGWKGIACVRQLVTPTNPETATQGDRRIMLGGLGRSTRVIESLAVFATDARMVAGPSQTFVSEYVKYLMANVLVDSTAYTALLAEKAAHTASADFDAEAADLGLVAFDLPYAAVAPFNPGSQLYLLAKYATSRVNDAEGAWDRSPYTIALADWVLANIQSMVAEFTV